MKTVIALSILFCATTLPALGELTDADLDKIRLIVKEEVKTEIAASEKRTKEYIDLKVDGLDQKVDALDKSLNARIDGLDQKVDDLGKSLNGRMDDIRTIMIALIALVTAAIAVPQIIMAYKERGQKDMQTQQREMQSQIDQLRAQIEAMQNTPS